MTTPAESKQTHGSPPSVKGLDLSFAMRHAELEPSTSDVPIQEQDILVIFNLPDGSQGESEFKLGHTIEFLKSYVECEFGIPMAEHELYLDDKLLLNPMSLIDYPDGIGNGEMYVRVEGFLPSESKK